MIYVVMVATSSDGGGDYDYVDSMWSTNDLADRRIAFLRASRAPYEYPHENYYITSSSVDNMNLLSDLKRGQL